MIRGLNKVIAAPGLGYLMSSYTSHPGGFGVAEGDAAHIAALLLEHGLVVFAPIAYGPKLEGLMTSRMLPDDVAYYRSHEFWMPICERFYERCDYAIIATTPGWYQSKGIAIEYDYLTAKSLPVHVYDVENDHILNLDEARQKWPEEFDALEALAIEHGMPPFAMETIPMQSRLASDRINSDFIEFEPEDEDA